MKEGAFTGEYLTKNGLLEAADKGSFFLDEIGDTPPAIQVKLLRVLQEKEFTRVGGSKSIKIDVRFISDTNRDLSRAVEENNFRQDLYYRLNVIPVYMPTLRERKEDIPQLAEQFIQKFNKDNEGLNQIEGIDPSVMKNFDNYSWPGNVRELENVLERACVFEREKKLQMENLPDELLSSDSANIKNIPIFNGDNPVDLEKTLDQIEKNMILEALKKTGGIMTKAAKLLNLSFRSMRYRMQKYKITVRTDVEEE
jgi:two-component system response regulator PilR (NtrC family)